jgi:FixJ family two-component response regulator
MPRACTVYIVDDDASVRRSLERLMRSCGYRAVTFASVDAFLAEPHLARPACIIADLMLRGESGMALPRALEDRGEHVPVILITASESEDTRAAARRAGASAFLRKPVDDRALIDSIEWVTGGARPARRDQTRT